MGKDGVIPPLHEGGMQEAVTAPAPIADALTVPTLPNTVLVAPEGLTEIGLLELQVRGTPVMVIPRMSVTVALRIVDVPVFTTNDVAGFPSAPIEIVWTGHVVNWSGWLLTPLALAKKKLEPGMLAVATCWFKHCPCEPLGHCVVPAGSAVKLSALALWPLASTLCQLNGPTEAVMSVFPLKANAW
jgi:hypothetical protein